MMSNCDGLCPVDVLVVVRYRQIPLLLPLTTTTTPMTVTEALMLIPIFPALSFPALLPVAGVLFLFLRLWLRQTCSSTASKYSIDFRLELILLTTNATMIYYATKLNCSYLQSSVIHTQYAIWCENQYSRSQNIGWYILSAKNTFTKYKSWTMPPKNDIGD